MNKIILKKEDIYKGDLILINQRHLLKVKENEIKKELIEVHDKYEKVLIRKDIQKILKDIFEKEDLLKGIKREKNWLLEFQKNLGILDM